MRVLKEMKETREKRNAVGDYCKATGCKNCVLAYKEWGTGGDRKCLNIAVATEEELDKAIDLITKAKVDEMFEHIEEVKPEHDIIAHPAHYTYSEYEPKDVIRAWGLNFNLGSAVKYVARAGRKDDIVQDLKKAKQFLEFEIEAIEKGL